MDTVNPITMPIPLVTQLLSLPCAQRVFMRHALTPQQQQQHCRHTRCRQRCPPAVAATWLPAGHARGHEASPWRGHVRRTQRAAERSLTRGTRLPSLRGTPRVNGGRGLEGARHAPGCWRRRARRCAARSGSPRCGRSCRASSWCARTSGTARHKTHTAVAPLVLKVITRGESNVGETHGLGRVSCPPPAALIQARTRSLTVQCAVCRG